MKTFFKIIKITLITIVSIILFICLYLYISNKVFLGSKNEENIKYLSSNKQIIDPTKNDIVFDDAFYAAKVILLGEIHGFADNQKLDKQLLIQLNKKTGLRHYIAEMDSTTAKMLNTYLADSIKKNEQLKQVVQAISKRIPQQSSVELFNKWSDIYDYNLTLPDSLKLVVIGIDTDFDDTKKTPRDAAMIENFKNAVKNNHLENARFYGLFGFFHVIQNQTANGYESFAARLKKENIKLVSMVSYTLDSDMYLPKNPQFPTPEDEKVNWVNADGPLFLVKGINDLKAESTPNSITLFKLNNANSPYLHSQSLLQMKSRLFGESLEPLNGSVTTDYFQYVFLLRNSKALTKL